MSNPDLLNPTSTVKASVPSVTKFKNILEDGRVVESIAPMPGTVAEGGMKAYFSAAINTNFIRSDGKKITFREGYYETDLYWDQWYLDNEISEGNPYVRLATEQEIHNAHMRMNPTQTIKDQLLSDPDVRKELEDKIRAEMMLANQGGVIPDKDKSPSLKPIVIAGDDNGAKLNPVSTKDLSGLLGTK